MFTFLFKRFLDREKTGGLEDNLDEQIVCSACSGKFNKLEIIRNNGRCPNCGSLTEYKAPTVFT